MSPNSLLIVEDCDIEREKIKRVISKMKVEIEVLEAENGEEGLDLLRDQFQGKKQTPLPIVFLDLNMPRMNGFEFLEELRQESDIKRAQVVVFTSSDHPKDILRAYDYNVAGYITKPDFKSLKPAMETIFGYFSLTENPGCNA